MDTHPWLSSHPARQLTAGGVTLRPWERADGPDLLCAVLESLEQLRVWMPWARPDYGPPDAERFIEHAIAARAAGSEFAYAIHDAAGELVGSCGLHSRAAPGGLEIGYWVHTAHTGRGLATRATAALVTAAMALEEVDHLEIRHDQANRRSARIPDGLGFARIATRARPCDTPGETGVEVVWGLDREAYDHGRARALVSAATRAADA